MTAILTDSEINELCAPLTMPAAQRRYLERLGLMVRAKPNGRALVARSEFERVLGADRFGDKAHSAATSGGANIIALRERVANGKKHGTKAQGR